MDNMAMRIESDFQRELRERQLCEDWYRFFKDAGFTVYRVKTLGGSFLLYVEGEHVFMWDDYVRWNTMRIDVSELNEFLEQNP